MSAPTRDEVIRMAREAGAPDPMVFLAAYERLVAAAYARGVAAEREACAKVCEVCAESTSTEGSLAWIIPNECAAAIRARGQA